TQAGLQAFLVHNSGFLVALLVVSVVGYVVRELRNSQAAKADGAGPEAILKRADEAAALPDSPELVWAGRVWLFLPQFVALMLAQWVDQNLFLSRYLSYTTLGGSILLAYWATRDPSRDVRLGLALALAATLFVWGYTPQSLQSRGLISTPAARDIAE